MIAVGPAGSIDGDRPLEELAQASGGDHTLGEFGVAAGLGDLRGGLLDEADVFPSQLDGVTVDDMDRSPSTVSARAGMEARTNRPARARSFMSFGLLRPLPFPGAARGRSSPEGPRPRSGFGKPPHAASRARSRRDAPCALPTRHWSWPWPTFRARSDHLGLPGPFSSSEVSPGSDACWSRNAA